MNTFASKMIVLLCVTLSAWANSFYGNILFEKGSDTLNVKAEQKLKSLFTGIKKDSLESNSEKIVITGFTDQTGFEQEDTTLAYKRAIAVGTFINNSIGIPKNLIIVRGESSKRYHILTVTAEGRRLNRRAELAIRKVTPKKKKDIPLVLHVVETKNLATPTLKEINSGDTIRVGAGGFCRLSYGSDYTLDLDEQSALTIDNKQVVLLSGTLQQHNGDETVKPLNYSANGSDINLTGDGVLSLKNDGSLFTSIYSGSGSVKSKYGAKSADADFGIAVLENGKAIMKVALPKAPTLSIPPKITLISGLTHPVSWNQSGELFLVRIGTTPLFDSLVYENRVTDTTYEIPSTPGTYFIQVQASNTPGFKSVWSKTVEFTVEKKPSLISLSPFTDTLFLTSHNRPYSVSGIADTNTELTMNGVELQLDKNGRFTHDFMLEDDINKLYFISTNPDLSKDTVLATVLYTGADEAIYINDSIMGHEAFTTSRHYRFRGSMPTATALSINGEKIDLDDNNYFEKRFKLPGYEKIPVKMEVTFKNGNTKIINRSIERIEHDTPIQQALYSVLGIAAVSALFVFIAFQVE